MTTIKEKDLNMFVEELFYTDPTEEKQPCELYEDFPEEVLNKEIEEIQDYLKTFLKKHKITII